MFGFLAILSLYQVLYGCETWSKIPKKQIKKLENIQKDAVTINNGLPASTPCKGMIYECGLKPMKYRIIEKTFLPK